MSTNTSSVKGSPGAISGTLITLYKRRWLIKYLVQRQLASSYRSSYLGLVWTFLSPLIMVALFTLVFSEMLGLRFREVTGDSSINFGLFLYCGLLPFLAWAQAMNQGVNVIRRNRGLVESVIFPLEILPLTSVVTALIQSFLGVPALMLVLVVLEQRLEWTAFLLPLVMVPQLLFTLGISYFMAIAGTYVPDISETLRGVVRAMFFITPIIWPPERIPENFRFLVDYNPLAFLVEAYRNLILDGKLPDYMAVVYFSLVALALFVVGLIAFNRVKHNFADML
ncbi:MAG TPA: ABC transporter permease [Rubrobacteraceae bacterium]|nr:ABC transporter permease [Rubrobacteraceae bacterium]